MNLLVSVCIPTYQRPVLLRQAIESCLSQTYKNIEVIICDDSQDNESEKVIQAINRPDLIRYYHNFPSLGQADNVNRLLDLAHGDRLVLLHDDDLLMPSAIQNMLVCWEVEPNLTACFGKQYVINMQGDTLEEQSCKLNKDYYRTNEYAGLQASALWSALVGQFPNDGYMILTAVAKQVRYRSTSDVGDACDFDFGLRLASDHRLFFFLNEYTAAYRLTDFAVSKLTGNNASNLSYRLMESLKLPAELEMTRSERLRKYALPAVNRWLAFGDRLSAYQVYTSKYYSWSQRLSLKGLLQILLIAFPANLTVAIIKLFKRFKSIKTINTTY